MTQATSQSRIADAADIRELAASFRRALRAQNRASETVRSYIFTVELLATS